MENSLSDQWLGFDLHITAEGMDLISGRGTKIPQAAWHGPPQKSIYTSKWCYLNMQLGTWGGISVCCIFSWWLEDKDYTFILAKNMKSLTEDCSCATRGRVEFASVHRVNPNACGLNLQGKPIRATLQQRGIHNVSVPKSCSWEKQPCKLRFYTWESDITEDASLIFKTNKQKSWFCLPPPHYLVSGIPKKEQCTINRSERLLAWLSGREPACQCRRCRFIPWAGKISWRRKWQPTPIPLPGKCYGQRSLVGYSPWGHESWTWLRD